MWREEIIKMLRSANEPKKKKKKKPQTKTLKFLMEKEEFKYIHI